MANQHYEFTLVLSGIHELSREVMDSFFDAGCDDAVVGMRDGVAFAEFCREANSFQGAVFSAIRNVEGAGVGAKVEHIEPDELVTMSEMARRLNMTREGIRKWVDGSRGPGNFPPPIGNLTKRSPIWRWTDILQWRQLALENKAKDSCCTDDFNVGSQIAAFNAILELRRRCQMEEIRQLLQAEGITQN